MKRLLLYEVPKSSSCAMGMDDEVDNIIVVVVAPCLSRRTFNFEARARKKRGDEFLDELVPLAGLLTQLMT